MELLWITGAVYHFRRRDMELAAMPKHPFPIRTIIVGVLLGVIGLQSLPTLPSPEWVAGVVAMFLIIMAGINGLVVMFHRAQHLSAIAIASRLISRHVSPRMWRSKATFQGLIFVCAMLAGFGYAWARAEYRLAGILSVKHQQKNTVINILLTELPQTRVGPRGQYFRYDAQVIHPAGGIPRLLRLTEYQQTKPLTVGENHTVLARLFPIHSAQNEFSFDYEGWLLAQGFGGSGQVLQRQVSAPAENWSMTRAVTLAQDYLLRRVQTVAEQTQKPIPEVLATLGLGVQSQLSSDKWQVLRESATLHLFSISGMHVVLLALIFGAVVEWLWRQAWRWFPQLARPIPAWWMGRYAMVAGGWAYGLLTGLGVPTQRTLIMLTVITLIARMGWQIHWTILAGVALIAVLIADPWAVFAPGFWLSFVGVMALFASPYGAKSMRHVVNASHQSVSDWWQSFASIVGLAMKTQLILSVVMIPWLVMWFGQWSLASLLANLLAVPFISFVLLPVVFGTIAFPTIGLLRLTEWLQSAYFWSMEFLVNWLPNQHTPMANWWAIALAVIGVVVLLLPRGVPLRTLGVVMILPLLVGTVVTPISQGHAKIHFYDVGSGMAVLVRTANHVLLYDTGSHREPFSALQWAILPSFYSLRIQALDALMLSHEDEDHAGGAQWLIDNGWIAPHGKVIWGGRKSEVSTGSPAIEPTERMTGEPENRKLNPPFNRLPAVNTFTVEDCEAMTAWQWDGVHFQPMTPLSAMALSSRNPSFAAMKSTNNRSCGLKISAGDHAVLLSGDWENAALEVMAEQHRQGKVKLSSFLLQLPHHGSQTSSATAFFQAVRPQAVLLSGGARQRNYPAKPVQESLQTLIPAPILWHTWHDGAVSVALSPISPPQITSYRQQHRRYWHEALATKSDDSATGN